jgi:hypothetical protein
VFDARAFAEIAVKGGGNRRWIAARRWEVHLALGACFDAVPLEYSIVG